jgi:hypothetical protein
MCDADLMANTPDPQPPQTALMLTREEWDDLSIVADAYVRRVAGGGSAASRRRIELCRRIIEAGGPW